MGTTWTAIRDGYIDDIKAITPRTVTTPRFAERPVKDAPLREWAPQSHSSAFRKFEILRVEGGAESPYQDPSEYELRETIEVVVSYPFKLRGLYGNESLDDLEVIMEQDADDIRDVLVSANNYQSGQNEAKRVGVSVEKEADIWFCVSRYEVLYYKSQTREDSMRHVVPIGPFSLEVGASLSATPMVVGAAFHGSGGPVFDDTALRQFPSDRAGRIRKISVVLGDTGPTAGTISFRVTINGVAQGSGNHLSVTGAEALGAALYKTSATLTPISYTALQGLGLNVTSDGSFTPTAIASAWLWVEYN